MHREPHDCVKTALQRMDATHADEVLGAISAGFVEGLVELDVMRSQFITNVSKTLTPCRDRL